LSRPKASKSSIKKKSYQKNSSFAELIKDWKSEFPQGLRSSKYPNLIDAVDRWRKSRNLALYAIVKSKPRELTKPIDSFLQEVENTAKESDKLAKEVCA
jgi:hypothetical protein